MQVDTAWITLDFTDYNFTSGLVDGNKVNLIAAVFLPIVCHNIIEL